ncbi:hypothetical protein FKP32DRAFT_1578912, partial [Trametes sanguinea]
HNGHHRNEGADRLAAVGAELAETPIPLEANPRYKQTGASLAGMTQKLAYRAIRKRKERDAQPRRATQESLTKIVEGVKSACGTEPTEVSVWKALSKPHVSRECRQFLWKAIHDAFMIGNKWQRPTMSPALRERAICKLCGCLEDMNHILFACSAEERGMAWDLMESLWRSTGEDWCAPGWGTILGAPCVTFSAPDGSRKHIVEARWTILATETAYMIWKLRCERGIQAEGKRYTAPEAANRWRKTIDDRLKIDRRMTAKSLGKNALQEAEVDAIWRPMLHDSTVLPTDWVQNNGVLVGIRRDV